VADIFLANDCLGTLPVAIACGRATYVNIRKAVHYVLSTNTSEILMVLASTAAGSGGMLSPVQLLWINLVSDVFPGIGLAMGEPDPSIMDRAPHPADEPILQTSDFARLAKEAGLITAGAYGAGLVGATRYGAGSPQAATMAFGSLVTGQLLHALTYAERGIIAPDGRSSSNPALLGIVGGSLLLQGAAMLVPGLRTLLGVAPLGALDLAAMIAGGVLPYLGNRALGGPAPLQESVQDVAGPSIGRWHAAGWADKPEALLANNAAMSGPSRAVSRSDLSRRVSSARASQSTRRSSPFHA
jgi:Ca2+-transporting ATPase